MKVKLRKMTAKEFNEFKDYSIKDYAKDLMKAEKLPVEIAESKAKEEFNETLIDGLDTENNALMIIEDANNDRGIGFIWYIFEETDGVKHSFLSDFYIIEEERRKGYAMAAINQMEIDACKNGCSESRLYVWNHNTPGVKLYPKCGYETFRVVEEGKYMRKIIYC